MVLLSFVHRVQGLMVPAGNPKAIGALQDLARQDVVFINRQRGIEPRTIQGYERQEFTHLAVVAAVQSGVAGCGLGILAAARALGLDFVPLLEERYDLIIRAEHHESSVLQPLLSLVRDPGFADDVERLGGYTTAQMGQVVAELSAAGTHGTIYPAPDRRKATMSLYVLVHTPTIEEATQEKLFQLLAGIAAREVPDTDWLRSWLAVDGSKMYCLWEAPDLESIHAALGEEALSMSPIESAHEAIDINPQSFQ